MRTTILLSAIMSEYSMRYHNCASLFRSSHG